MPTRDPKQEGREPTASGAKPAPTEVTSSGSGSVSGKKKPVEETSGSASGKKLPIDDASASGLKKLLDTYERGAVKADPKATKATETAPEIARAFKERAFVARGVMSKEDVVSALQQVIRETEPDADLLEGWIPFLRQAVEQAGGDGIDNAIVSLLKPPAKSANVLLVQNLRAAFQAMHRLQGPARTESAEQIIELIKIALEAPNPPRISMKGLQRDLEGRVELDTLLWLLFAADDALIAREAQVTVSLESLRAQLRLMPGKQPEGMLWNFGRLKAERDLLLAERARR